MNPEAKINEAIGLLRQARVLLRKAGAGRAAGAVSRSLKSVDGARRHARGIADRQHRQED